MPYRSRDAKLKYLKKHYARHREARLAYAKAYYAKHRKTIRLEKAAYYIKRAGGLEFDSVLIVPKSVRHLRLTELPVSTRLSGVLGSMRIRTLGGVDGRCVGEFFRRKNCGRGSVLELEQLIQRAASGEFDDSNIGKPDAPRDLLNLIEASITKLPARDENFVLARFGTGRKHRATLKQIGQRYGMTRERVRVILEKLFGVIRRSYGPRIPELLEHVRQRCISNICPLTPELLHQWARQFRSRIKLAPKAHVRIISSLDERIPCWPNGHEPLRIDENVRRLGVSLAGVLRKAGGRITLGTAYRNLKGQRQFSQLNVPAFLRMLRNARRVRIQFDDPEKPVIRLSRPGYPARAESQRRRKPPEIVSR